LPFLRWGESFTARAADRSLLIARPARAQGGEQKGGASPPKAGCPFKGLTARVPNIFGGYDRALFNGGDVEGGEIPHLVKLRELSMYTCVFQRSKAGETLQFIANFYPDAAQALDALGH